MRALIVDGYNVIFGHPPLAAIAQDDIDRARVLLVEQVAAFAHTSYDATVVFDGGGNPVSEGTPHNVAGVTVIFSRHGEEADAAVERLAVHYAEKGERVTVVTSDQATQQVVSGAGVLRMSSAEFGRTLDQRDEEDGADDVRSAGRMRSTVGDRLGVEVAERLGRWARGLD